MLRCAAEHARRTHPGLCLKTSALLLTLISVPTTTEPSNEDRAVTETLVEAVEILGIPVIDHSVFIDYAHSSFRERAYLLAV